MLKAYKFRLYPNKEQSENIKKHIGCCRFVYNHFLDVKIQAYSKEKKSLGRFDLNKLLPELKEEHDWLKEVNAQSLQQANNHLDSAFKKFFREKKGFPRFKSKHNAVQSFTVPQSYAVDTDNNKVRLPKIGKVKVVLHREIIGNLKTATVSRTPTGKYFISILVEDDTVMPNKKQVTVNSTVGIDMGLTHFATLSDGQRIDNPRYLKNSLDRLKILQKRASRKVKRSNNRRKANLKVAKIHERIKNQRTDFIHKFTHKIVGENQAIAIETLSIKDMVKDHTYAQSIHDACWGECFRQLEYKSDWYGKTVLKIGRFEPSSKICHVCGKIDHNLTIKDRTWICDKCKTEHDRDLNASINIKNIALQSQNMIGIVPKGLRVGLLEVSA